MAKGVTSRRGQIGQLIWESPCIVASLYLAALALLLVRTSDGQENIALNQTTYQSSMKKQYGPYLAVDGNKNVTFAGKSCTHTLTDVVNPWWAVDLQWSRLVANVSISNRGDECCVDRLRNIRIGVTDTSPVDVTPALANMDVCFCQDAPLPGGATSRVYCGAAGRYLVIFLEGVNTLTLCEVEVFEGETNPPPFTPQWRPGFRLSQNTTLSRCGLESVTGEQQRDWFSCFARCLRNPCCQAVNITGCKWSGLETEQLDFVKEKQGETRTCAWKHGVNIFKGSSMSDWDIGNCSFDIQEAPGHCSAN